MIRKINILFVLIFCFLSIIGCSVTRNYSETSSARNKNIVADIDYYDFVYNTEVIVLPAKVNFQRNIDVENNFVSEFQMSGWGNSIKDVTKKEIAGSGHFDGFGHHSGRIEISTEVEDLSIKNNFGDIRSKSNVTYTYKDLISGKTISRRTSSVEAISVAADAKSIGTIFTYNIDQLTYAIAREAVVGLILETPLATLQLTQKQVNFYNSNIKNNLNQLVSYIPIDDLAKENKKELAYAGEIAQKNLQEDSIELHRSSSGGLNDNNLKKSKVRVGAVNPPARKNSAPIVNKPLAGTTIKPGDAGGENQSVSENPKKKKWSRGDVEALFSGSSSNNASTSSEGGYIPAPGHYQPKNKVEEEQERAMDEWMQEERAKLHETRSDAASRTGYTASPGHYQPTNKIEAEQERAMDEWMEEERNNLRR